MNARLLRPGDEQLLVAATLSIDHVALSFDRARSLLNDSSFVATVAFEGDVAGLAFGQVLRQLKGDALLLYSIAVSEKRRRRGAALAMIAELTACCAERNLYEMWVLTDEKNEGAMALYKRAGGVRERDDQAMWIFPIVKSGRPVPLPRP